MMETLFSPLSYDYMQKAMWVSAVVGGICGLLSCFVTLKGWSLMGDALSHAVVPGVALASIAGAPFAAGAFVAGVLAALGMGFIKSNSQLKEDAVIGVVFTAFFAAGLLLITLFPSGVSLRTIIFGNILGIADEDAIQVLLIAFIVLIVLLLRLRDLVLFCFDPQQARTLGLNTKALHFTLLLLLAATTIAALQAVGACLVVATLVTPGATAYLLTDRFSTMLKISGSIGVLTGLLGAYASYFIDGSTGGCIVTLQTIIFVGALTFAPKHGIVATKRLRRLALSPRTP